MTFLILTNDIAEDVNHQIEGFAVRMLTSQSFDETKQVTNHYTRRLGLFEMHLVTKETPILRFVVPDCVPAGLQHASCT